MHRLTRARFNAYAANLATIYDAQDSQIGTANGEWFSIQGPSDSIESYAAGATPSPEQRLVTRMQDSIDFLQRINLIPVDQLIGDTIGLEMAQSVISRTNTGGTTPPTRRQPVDPTGLDNFPYLLSPTEFNIAFNYAKLDAWAKFPDFEVRMQNAILKRMGLDRIKVGWNGTSIATNANPVTDPTLATQNIGWLQLMRNNAPTRVMTTGLKTAGQVSYGTAAADYETLDALIYDAIFELLPPWARNDPDMVVIVGADLLHDKYFMTLNQNVDPLNQLALDGVFSSQRLGRRPAYRVPDMPLGTVLITRFDNLSLYYQTGRMRRRLVDEPQYNRMADYSSSNEGYVIEDYSYACVIENIVDLAAPTGTAAAALEAAAAAATPGELDT